MAHTPHTYNSPALESQIGDALKTYATLCGHLNAIQQMTGIPGLHTDINSDDDTPGVLERLQAMHDCGETSVEAFKTFDAE